MDVIISLLLFVAVYASFTYLAFLLRPSSAISAIVLALPLFICFETILLNVLSIFYLVRSDWVIALHVFFALGVVIHVVLNRSYAERLWLHLCGRVRLLFNNISAATVLLIPLLLIIGFTAFLYVPNTYDSMTYHLARVAHWIQNGSIEYYRTHIPRQNQMGPGAEYIILFFQITSGSDRLANGIQFLSYLLIPAGLFYLLRVLKVNRRSIPWIILACMTTPMAVLQASSSQNDLVDAVLMLCIAMVSIRLLVGDLGRMRRNDIILGALCCAAAYLVKPIALIVAFPLILIGCVFQGPKLIRFMVSRAGVSGLLISLILIAIICGPDIGRKIGTGAFGRHEIYPLFGEWDTVRLLNPLALIAHNFPFPGLFKDFVVSFSLPIDVFNAGVFYVHEDFIGNPIQLFLLLVPGMIAFGLLLPGLLWGSKRWVTILVISLIPILSWCMFGWIIKNQVWITRLQLPLFFLLPFSLAIFFSHPGKRGMRMRHGALILIVLCSYAYGMKVVSMNPTRPMDIKFFWGDVPSAFENYYRTFNKKKEHNNFLRVAQEQNCKRAYLLIMPDYPEYPLTWRAMQQGIRVRHAFREDVDAWPCMLFADGVKVSYVPDRGTRWIETGESHTLIRNLEYEFAESEETVWKIERWLENLDLDFSKGTTLSYLGDHLQITGVDSDPYIILKDVIENLDGATVLRIVINTPIETEFKLYYKTVDTPFYNEENMFRKQIQPGPNDIYFQLPGDEIVGSLRFDPGNAPGDYEIQSLEIRRITDH